MSKKLLREYYALCEGGVCQDLLTEEEKRYVADGGMILSGIMQMTETQNGNGRVYPHTTMMREVKNYEKLVKECRALGELDHPDDSVINLRNASHMVGVSSRGMGSVREEKGQTMVEDDFQLICFDMVSEPSTPGAFMMREAKEFNNSVFTKADKINRLLNEVLSEEE
jgi:hypothetical protein